MVAFYLMVTLAVEKCCVKIIWCSRQLSFSNRIVRWDYVMVFRVFLRLKAHQQAEKKPDILDFLWAQHKSIYTTNSRLLEQIPDWCTILAAQRSINFTKKGRKPNNSFFPNLSNISQHYNNVWLYKPTEC